MPPKINLIKLNKPEIKSSKKLKAFVWKRIILDRQNNNGQVAKKDLKALDPNWKGKHVVWKDIEEHKKFTLELIEELYADKTKVAVAKAVDSGQINMNKLKTYFASDKQQNLFIMLSRLPKVEILLSAVDNLNDKTVSQDNLQSLIRLWPADEYEGLIQEAQENPEDKWEKSETYFIKLGTKKKFDLRIKLWFYKSAFEANLNNLIGMQKELLKAFK